MCFSRAGQHRASDNTPSPRFGSQRHIGRGRADSSHTRLRVNSLPGYTTSNHPLDSSKRIPTPGRKGARDATVSNDHRERRPPGIRAGVCNGNASRTACIAARS